MDRVDRLGTLYRQARDAFARFPGSETARFAARLPADPGAPRPVGPTWRPAAAQLGAAEPGRRFRPLVKALCDAARLLDWRSNYSARDVGRAYAEFATFVELLGPRGHFAAPDIAFGVVVIGPDVHYPDHRHVAEEIYAPIAGRGEWRYHMDVWREHGAGATVYTPPLAWHALRTGDEVLLLLYAWIGGDLAQKSEIAQATAGN